MRQGSGSARLVSVERVVLALVAAALLGGAANAQAFDENRYYQQCLRFEAGGDLEAARLACLNALQVRPSFAEADLALARIELQLGNVGSAEQRLRRVRNVIDDAWPLVLLAEAALMTDRPLEAEGLLQQARTRLVDRANRELDGRVSMIGGRIAQYRGDYDQALSLYGSAITADALNVQYRMFDANLRLRMGDTASAAQQLTSYMLLTGDDRNPAVRSLLAHALWAQGDMEAAAGHLEVAHQLRGSRDVEAQTRDLRSLALIRYGQGDFDAGLVALRESVRRENLLSYLTGNTIVWLLVLLLLVAVHLVGESRIASSNTLEVIDGPRPWSVGQVYGTLIASLIIALFVTVFFGVVRFENPLVLFTPVQGSEARALFLLTLAVMLALMVSRRAQANGFDAMEILLGRSDKPLLGVGWGLMMLAATLAYLHYKPLDGVLGGFYLDLLQLTPFVVAAVILLPLVELFFRAFMMSPLTKRYDATIAVILSASLYSLVFGTPVALLFVFGLVLGQIHRRRKNGLEPLLAQLTLHIGLLVAVAVSPWARSLFFA